MWVLKLALISAIITITSGANILFFFGLSTYSHRIVVWPLVEKLAERGHDVTFVQSYTPKSPHPKVKEFFPEKQRGPSDFDKLDLLTMRLKGGRQATLDLATHLPTAALNLCETFLKDPETKEWVRSSKFDLVVIDGLMNECGLGLAHKFKAKTIIFGTSHPFTWWYDSFGIVPETSWTPELHLSYQYPMSFFERVKSTLLPLAIHYVKQNSFFPALGKVFQRELGLGEDLDVAELERQTSVIFTNTHFSEELGRSLPPLVIPVGGIHCEDKSQTLSKELKAFIDGSGNEGFIYISFGSAARVSTAPPEFKSLFFKALGNSKLRFVWKYEAERTADIPPNVFVDTWMPQQAILAHPKIKAFLTHAGLLGIQEAVWHGVPLIAMPIFAEQDFNAFRVQRTQRGIMIEPSTLTQETLEDAIRTISRDPKFRKNMQELSIRFKDRPQKAADTAVWWTEYVLRTDDTSSLKPLSIQQTWYERRLLDVWGFLFLVLATGLLLILYITRRIFKLFRGPSKGAQGRSLKKQN